MNYVSAKAITPAAITVTAIIVSAFSSASAPPPAGSDNAQAALRPLVAEAFSSGFSPGLSVAVVRHDGILWTEGFGEADREKNHPVTPDTRFYIASTSKALTALAAVRLAERGELDLDAPLSRALPGAMFPPGIEPDSIHLIDLLTHTHGIDGQGPVSLRVAFTGDYTNDDLLRILSAHRPAAGGRSFSYSNLGYDLIGIILAPSVTRGWRDVVEREVTAPMGMAATTAWRSRVPEDLLAQPYEIGPDGFERVRLAKSDETMGPAGGHFSTALDLSRLLMAELDHGRLEGRQVLSPRVVAETQRFHAVQDRDFAFIHRHGWGVGWDLGTYEGDTLVHRFGSFPGYRSHVSFMPARDIGIVVLTNGGQLSSRLADLIAAALYDRMLERPEAGERLAAGLAELRAGAEKARAEIAADRARRAARSQDLPHPLSAYVGRYRNSAFGTLVLQIVDDSLEAVMGLARSNAEVYDGTKNQFRVELLGGGQVLSAQFEPEAENAGTIRFLDAVFERE